MSFEKNFCPSPWFHMRINNSGAYEYCRWQVHKDTARINVENNIKNQSPIDYFQTTMAPLRQHILNGTLPPECNDCKIMEKHNKVSGRQKQLLKVGVREPWFAKTLLSSPLKSAFDYSDKNLGITDRHVLDWQIDLGNYCNGACLYCNPSLSSKLASEFKAIGLIDQLPPTSWCDDPLLLERFIKTLIESPHLQYLHFIGGETLITPGFKKILLALVEKKLSNQITIGFTTNLNSWDENVVNLLREFQTINLGLSIDTLTLANDYVRWPSKQSTTRELLDRWVKLAQNKGWLLQLRSTPTCLTIQDLDTLYDYAWEHNICVESCNFLYDPSFMRIDVLPREYKEKAKIKLQKWVNNHSREIQLQVINIRNPTLIKDQIIQDAQSYIDYLDKSHDESYRLTELIDYIRRLESSRKNKILDYIPEYEELFRSAGY